MENQEEQLNEEYLQMQKLAGVITEEEYTYQKAQLWYKNYAENLKKTVDDFGQFLKDKGYDI
jgi:hypothetical protein